MKNLLLPAVALMAVSAGSALAADLPIRKAPPMAPAMVTTNWSGCYVGAGGGYGMFNNETSTVFDPGGVPVGFVDFTHGGRGWFGTVQVGCDIQFGGNWVIGVFGDYDFADIKGDHLSQIFGVGGENRLDSSWAVGGRVGWLVTPQLLTFVSGGYTEARFEAFDLGFVGGGPLFSIGERTHDGWFIGGGVEYQLGWFPGLYWKTEYRVAEYEKLHTPLTIFATGVPTGFAEVHEPFVQTVRSELVWRWNWGR
jgi:outer membrane immunogenic protein